MKTLAVKLANAIHRENPNLSELDRLKMQYGIECFLNEFTKIAAFFIIFSIAGLLMHYLVVLAFMSALRPFVGGYHSKSSWRCFLTSFIFFVSVIYAGQFLELSILYKSIVLFVSLITILVIAPVDHPAKPIRNEGTRIRYKLISIFATAAAGGIGYFLPTEYSELAFFSILGVVLLAVIGYFIYPRKQLNERFSNKKVGPANLR